MRMRRSADPSSIDPDGTADLDSGVVARRGLADATRGEAEPGEPAPAPFPARYEDLGLLARGNFGDVRRAWDTLLDRVVALKLLRAEHVGHPHVRRRFLAEASITAQLQHPSIVAVHDRGELPDGRLWYAMKEVRGRTLQSVLQELHAASGPSGWGTTSDGWTFRRVVDAFARIAQSVAYAHSHGVVHRDLKPANLMVGQLGEVLVMDWGLARQIGAPDPEGGGVRGPLEGPGSWGLTRLGDVLGTPAFMSPEQARGDTARHGPASDVYSLGAVLYTILSGKASYPGESAREVLLALVSEEPQPVIEAARGGPSVPRQLCAVVDRAMRREIEERYPSAEALAADVVAWLDGVQRQEQATSALARARRLEPEIAGLRAQAAEAEARARALRSGLQSFDPVEKKRPAWAAEDEAARQRRAAALAETRWMEAVQGALSVDPDLPEAHAMLADHHRERLIEAELSHRDEDAARGEELLRIHDRGAHAVFLRGDGALTLLTDPEGAEVIVERFELRDRRLVPVRETVLGPTPILEAPLKRGSYLLRCRAPGRAEVRYPVLIERAGHWDGRAPGERDPLPIVLPGEGELGPDEVYVPAGWCRIGGDPEAPDSLSGRQVWIDAFVMRRFPVTTSEYLGFLNDLLVNGREAEAIAACPRAHEALSDAAYEPLFDRDGSGLYRLPPEREGSRWQPDWPVVLIDWASAMAYARWLAGREGRDLRLPDELEREKAARGADGRRFAWGDHPEPTFARVVDTSPAEATRESVFGHPWDESPYGIRGLSGNTRDFCLNVWKHEGPRVEGGRLVIEPASPADPDFRAVRGGAWTGTILQSRAAARFGARPGARRSIVGLRVVRSLLGR